MHYRAVILTSILILSAEMLYCQAFSEKKTFRNSFPSTRETMFELDNKYGTIQITPWNKDSVSVRAEVEVSASKLDRLHKLFGAVDVNISEAGFIVRAKTEFTQNLSMLLEDFKGMTSRVIPYESKIQINYFVNAPDYIKMKIVNKYGDVFMESSTGKFSLNLSNGSFKANSLGESCNIELVFCDATIRRIDSGYLNASFSEIVITETKDLTIKSISSRFDIQKSDRLSTESKRDKFFMGYVNSLSGNSYFTDFRIDEVQNEINLVTKYGSITADMIRKDFDLVNINSSYSDINLSFDPSVSYNLDIRSTGTFLVLPDKNNSLEKKTLDDDKKEVMTFGTVGRNPGNKKVTIEATRGNIFLK